MLKMRKINKNEKILYSTEPRQILIRFDFLKLQEIACH